MAQTPSWDSKGLPENLRKLIEGKEGQERFSLWRIYFLELDHKLMGCFPAILKGKGSIVIVTNPKVLVGVSGKLPPRAAKVTSRLAYVNYQRSAAYIIRGTTDDDLEKSTPQELFSPERVGLLLERPISPFEWAPGLVGDDMSREEFLCTVKAATG